MTDLTIVVVNYNTRKLLRECLLSIRRYAPPGAEVIVVDNASNDGSPDLVRSEFSSYLLLANTQNLGYPRAVNQALRLGRGDLFLVLNADTQLTQGSIETIVSYMCDYHSVGIVAPANVTPDGKMLLTVHRDVTLAREILRNFLLTDVWRYRVLGHTSAERLNAPTAIDWATGSALMVRQEVIEAIGGMDETVFLYGEEYDWQLRARQAGWEVHFVPQAKIIHHQSASVIQNLGVERYRLVTRSTYYFYAKHHGKWGLPILMGAHGLGSALRLLLSGILRMMGKKEFGRQAREHVLVIRDLFDPSMHRWLIQALVSSSSSTMPRH